MYNTGAPVMDKLNEEWIESAYAEIPFTLMITVDAIVKDDSDRFHEAETCILPDYREFVDEVGYPSSFPEEWIEFDVYSDGRPVLSGLPAEVLEYADEVMTALDYFIAEEDDEDAEEVEQITTLPKKPMTPKLPKAPKKKG